MKRNLFAILFFSYLFTSAQKPSIDSLRNLINSPSISDSLKSDICTTISYQFHEFSMDSSKVFAHKALDLARKNKLDDLEANALRCLAISYYLTGDFDAGKAYNDEALGIFTKIGNKRGIADVLNNMAIMLNNSGYFDEALEYYIKSTKIREELGDSIRIADSYNNIGNTYSDLGNYTLALQNLYKALTIRERLGKKVLMAHSYSNIARIYMLMNRLDDAALFAKHGYKLAEETTLKHVIAYSCSILGNVYHKMKDYESAYKWINTAMELNREIKNMPALLVDMVTCGDVLVNLNRNVEAVKLYQEALVVAKSGPDWEGIAAAYIGLGTVYLEEGKYAESISASKEAVKASELIKSKLRASESYKLLADAYKKIKNYEAATQALDVHILYKDSLFTEESDKKASEMKYNFLLDKKEREIMLLEKNKSLKEKESEKQRLVVAVLVITLLFVLIALYLLFRSRQKEVSAKQLIIQQKKEIETQTANLEQLNALKDKIFSILSHDLRSPVSSLISVMGMLGNKMISIDDFNALKETFDVQLRSLSTTLDNLLYWSKSQITGESKQIKTVFDVSEVIQHNVQLLSHSAVQKRIELDLSEVTTINTCSDKNDIDIIIRNLLSNAIKFTKPSGTISITTSVHHNMCKVSVADNGVGMPVDVIDKLLRKAPIKNTYGTAGEKGTGIGLIICKEFIERNGGELLLTSEIDKGSTFSITIPLA